MAKRKEPSDFEVSKEEKVERMTRNLKAAKEHMKIVLKDCDTSTNEAGAFVKLALEAIKCAKSALK